MFSRHCPLIQPKLSVFMRIMYSSGVWSYIVGALTAPMYFIMPLLTIWAGVFPIVVSEWAASAPLSPPCGCRECSSHHGALHVLCHASTAGQAVARPLVR